MGDDRELTRSRIRILRPLRRRTDVAQRRLRHGVYLLPSMFTLANMFCGYACIVYSMRGEFVTAAPFIGLAIVVDMLDGRIARMTGSASDFGVEFDSLADVVSFGLAPAILTFAWGLHGFGQAGWAAGFIFVAAAAIRLARFNIQTNAPAADKRFFVGMPSPAAAGVLAATVFWHPEFLVVWPQNLLALPMVLVPAFLMVSTVRYRSFKSFDLGTRRSYRGLLLVALVFAAIATHPQITLLVVAYGYLASGLIGWAWGRLGRRSGDPAPADVPAAPTAPATEPPGVTLD